MDAVALKEWFMFDATVEEMQFKRLTAWNKNQWGDYLANRKQMVGRGSKHCSICGKTGHNRRCCPGTQEPPTPKPPTMKPFGDPVPKVKDEILKLKKDLETVNRYTGMVRVGDILERLKRILRYL